MADAGRHIPDWLARRAADRPEGVALIAGSGPDATRWTYSELDVRAGRLAERLAVMGVTASDRVAVLLPNGPLYVEAVHALIRLRAILVPINLRLAPAEAEWQLQNSGARLLLHDGATASLAETFGEVPRLLLEYDAGGWGQETGGAYPIRHARGITEASALTPVPDPRLDLDAVQCVMYTSGTTGRPKGALLTYGNHWWSAVGSALNLGLHADDRWLACLPFFHIGGLSILMRAAIYGIPVVLPEAPIRPHTGPRLVGFDPQAINRALNEEVVTLVSVVSAMLPRLFEAQEERPYPPSLRCLLLGGGPAPRPLLEECARRGIPVTQTYGLTETASQVATLAPDDAMRKLGAAGRPLLPNELRIAPLEDDGQTSAPKTGNQPAGDVYASPRSGAAGTYLEGEILVRGPSITAGYLPENGDIATLQPATDAEGWLHTGDIGYLDHEGFLYVLDRRTDLIVSGGENVYPAEVEAVLLGHPAIAEAGVYGVEDERWGQRAAAVVVAHPGADIDTADIMAFCRTHLAAYKVPASIHVVETLPRNAAGKLLRRRLHDSHR